MDEKGKAKMGVDLPDWANRFVSFDTETTGTDEHARILEFGAVLWEKGEISRRWDMYLNPGAIDLSKPDVKEALTVNGIDPESLVGAPTFVQACKEIMGILAQADVRVAHASRFDSRMVRQEFERGVQEGKLKWEDAGSSDRKRVLLDTQALDLYLNPLQCSRSLKSTAARWGVSGWQEHRACGDAEAAGRIFLAMAPKLPDLATTCKENRLGQDRWDVILAERKARATAGEAS